MANKKDVTDTWFILEWKDEAGRSDSMAGPKAALLDKEAELKKNKVDYTLEELATVTTRMATKEVAGKELEVR